MSGRQVQYTFQVVPTYPRRHQHMGSREDYLGHRWTDGPIGLLATAWFMWLFIGAWAITPSSVLPLAMEDFGVRETAAAWIITTPQLAATVTGIPIGMYLDRVDQRRSVFAAAGIMLVVGIAATLAAGAGMYWGLLGARVVGGLALVTIWTAQTAMITRAFPTDQEATAVGFFVTGYPAGYALGQFSGPLVASALDWTATFAIYAGGGFAFGVLFWVLSRGVSGVGTLGSAPSIRELGRALTNVGVWGVSLLSLLAYMLYMIFNSWMPTYINTTFGVGLAQSGLYSALFPAIGIVSRPLGGYVSERVFDGRGRPVVAISFVVAGMTAAVMAFGETITALIVGLVAAGFFLQLQIGLLYTLVQAYVPGNVAGTAVAVVSAIGWLGIFVGPPAVGALIEVSGTYQVVFGAAVALAVAGAATVIAISEPESQ